MAWRSDCVFLLKLWIPSFFSHKWLKKCRMTTHQSSHLISLYKCVGMGEALTHCCLVKQLQAASFASWVHPISPSDLEKDSKQQNYRCVLSVTLCLAFLAVCLSITNCVKNRDGVQVNLSNASSYRWLLADSRGKHPQTFLIKIWSPPPIITNWRGRLDECWDMFKKPQTSTLALVLVLLLDMTSHKLEKGVFPVH